MQHWFHARTRFHFQKLNKPTFSAPPQSRRTVCPLGMKTKIKHSGKKKKNIRLLSFPQLCQHNTNVGLTSPMPKHQKRKWHTCPVVQALLPSSPHQYGCARDPSARPGVRALPGPPRHQPAVRVLSLVGHLGGGSLGRNRHLVFGTRNTKQGRNRTTARSEHFTI